MGAAQRPRVTRWAAAMALALVTLAAACSGGDPDPAAMLLSPADFPDGGVTGGAAQADTTFLGVSAAQVELSGPDFTLSHSVLLFATAESALLALAGIKQDQLAQGILLPDPGEFQDISGILNEVRDGRQSQTLFFVEGRALVRLTTSGPGGIGRLPSFAANARGKAGGK